MEGLGKPYEIRGRTNRRESLSPLRHGACIDRKHSCRDRRAHSHP